MTQPQDRTRMAVGHITFETLICPRGGITFALIAGDARSEAARRPLFAGHVVPGMATELRRLAHHLDDLEAKQNKKTVPSWEHGHDGTSKGKAACNG